MRIVTADSESDGAFRNPRFIAMLIAFDAVGSAGLISVMLGLSNHFSAFWAGAVYLGAALVALTGLIRWCLGRAEFRELFCPASPRPLSPL